MSYSPVAIVVTLLLFASGPSVVDHQAQAQMFGRFGGSMVALVSTTLASSTTSTDSTTAHGGITSGGIPGGTFTGSTRTAEIPCDDL
jgi:hypothetical protein